MENIDSSRKATFDLEVMFSHSERSLIQGTVATPGFPLIKRIMKSVADEFWLDVINTDATDEKRIVAKQHLAKAASIYFTKVVDRINEELMQYDNAPRANAAPVDNTDGLLDLGEIAGQIPDDYNIFSEGGIIDE